jgi:hypothetical protein
VAGYQFTRTGTVKLTLSHLGDDAKTISLALGPSGWISRDGAFPLYQGSDQQLRSGLLLVIY